MIRCEALVVILEKTENKLRPAGCAETMPIRSSPQSIRRTVKRNIAGNRCRCFAGITFIGFVGCSSTGISWRVRMVMIPFKTQIEHSLLLYKQRRISIDAVNIIFDDIASP
jgi:hypothetical protein